MRGFGARSDSEGVRAGEMIWTSLPEDFGAPGYAVRRAHEIDKHLGPDMMDRANLEWLFEYWLDPSAALRQYLWAHDPNDVVRARKVARVLPPLVIVRILRYLVASYWHHYTGWPDLLVHRDGEFVFIEVKASKDSLSDDQKRWIKDNSTDLHLPFKIVKIHKERTR